MGGTWTTGTISADGVTLTWHDGGSSNISLDGDEIRLYLDGEMFQGRLEDGRIIWSDGDIWERISKQTQETPLEEIWDTPRRSPRPQHDQAALEEERPANAAPDWNGVNVTSAEEDASVASAEEIVPVASAE